MKEQPDKPVFVWSGHKIWKSEAPIWFEWSEVSNPMSFTLYSPPTTQRAQHRAEMAEWWREQPNRG